MTDHRARARESLEMADMMTDPRSAPNSQIQEAQVHATLYLAEQQRIANLIAILSADNADFFNLMPAEAARPEMYGSMIGAMLADVQKALGYEQEEIS